MSNSYKSYSTNLEKREIKDKHAERRAYQELKDKIEHREHARQLIKQWDEMEDAKNNLGV